GIFFLQVVQRAPRSDVVPADVGGKHVNVGGVLKNGDVDGRLGHLCVRPDEVRFGAGALKYFPVGGNELGEGVGNGSQGPDENTAVPVQVAAVDQFLRLLPVGLFEKTLRLEHAF